MDESRLTEPLIEFDYRGEAVTVIAFSGMMRSNRVYEWTRSFAGLPANFIGVQDPLQRWYQVGTAEIAKALRIAIRKAGGSRLVLIGGSGGGFAALLFAAELGADRVLALSPQSACGAAKRALGDDRWPDMCQVTPSCDIAGRYPEALVHVAADDPLDMMHAERLMPDRLVVHERGGHGLPTALKASGDLRGILQEAIAA